MPPGPGLKMHEWWNRCDVLLRIQSSSLVSSSYSYLPCMQTLSGRALSPSQRFGTAPRMVFKTYDTPGPGSYD